MKNKEIINEVADIVFKYIIAPNDKVGCNKFKSNFIEWFKNKNYKFGDSFFYNIFWYSKLIVNEKEFLIESIDYTHEGKKNVEMANQKLKNLFDCADDLPEDVIDMINKEVSEVRKNRLAEDINEIYNLAINFLRKYNIPFPDNCTISFTGAAIEFKWYEDIAINYVSPNVVTAMVFNNGKVIVDLFDHNNSKLYAKVLEFNFKDMS